MSAGGNEDVPEYNDFLEAVDAGDPFALVCPNDHHWIPPRRVCPSCGSTELRRESVPTTGSVVTYTRIEVPPSEFVDDVPYTTGIASFGPVSITGLLRGVDPANLEIGQTVTLLLEHTAADEEVVTFRPK
ncbi:Zn-ribbon domain-containing OB-fold protein [Natronosalvus caseinilyticus]|uniref:Zn-ribbon domain-containing OB-fold protein n=1 Tax=Natronosalvus caseinilyticus TaxID=2953747 RepID=UPI0028A660B1|nr:OB-fold domain-containing protein [Natronosalvus caseinilyticus]